MVKEADSTANPGPLGLLAFGMTTVLLNFHNAGLFPLGTMILAMGIFYGGFAQVLAGIFEWKKGNTFGTTAFISYGFFWLTLVGLLVFPTLGYGTAPTANSMGFYLAMWGLFTLFMFKGTLKIRDKKLQIIFGSLIVLFALLAISDFTGNAMIKQIAGFEGIICGGSAIYAAFSGIYKELGKK